MEESSWHLTGNVSYWLTFIGLKGAMHATHGEKQSPILPSCEPLKQLPAIVLQIQWD